MTCCFNGDIAGHYLETRFIPANRVKKLLSAAIDEVSKTRAVREIADVGCGTGRLLRALPLMRKSFRCTAFDISETMLERIPRPLLRQRAVTAYQRDCSLPHALGTSRFDLIITHWIANVAPRWPDIFRSCVQALKPGGSLLWFDESSDLYHAIDGHLYPLLDVAPEFVCAFWMRFHSALGPWGERDVLVRRPGLTMQDPAREAFVASCGLRTRPLARSEQCWRKYVTVDWIMNRVLRERAFSNLWRIPERRYASALEKLREWLSKYPRDLGRRVTLRYRSTPMIIGDA